MNLIIRLVVITLAVAISAYVLPGVSVDGAVAALIVGIVLIALNMTVKPILNILTLPISLLTLGLFSIVINGFIIVITDFLVAGFAVENFLWAVLFALVLSIVTSVLETIAGDK